MFLVAITSTHRVLELVALSCKEPFLALHHDKGVLRTQLFFMPKLFLAFHVNQDIVLPPFCFKPQAPGDKALHASEVVLAIRIYLKLTAMVRQSDSLFVLPEGLGNSHMATKFTISSLWSERKASTFSVMAHSTRSVGATCRCLSVLKLW